jgi:hypothetical protein
MARCYFWTRCTSCMCQQSVSYVTVDLNLAGNHVAVLFLHEIYILRVFWSFCVLSGVRLLR